jgi:hypothetical protein
LSLALWCLEISLEPTIFSSYFYYQELEVGLASATGILGFLVVVGGVVGGLGYKKYRNLSADHLTLQADHAEKIKFFGIILDILKNK